jgi:TolA-binding protein
VRPQTGIVLIGLLLAQSGCLVFQGQHDELAKEVNDLEKKVASRDKELEETLAEAEAQMAEVQSKLDKAEELLRTNQASLGIRVEDMEGELAQTRGVAEDSLNELAALSQNVEEMRGELDERVSKLETATNAANNIPEGKSALIAEAERQKKAKHPKEARRLYRIYLSRYPSDAKEPDVRFKIGLTLFSERDYRSALGEFYWIVQNAPESTAIHDGLYYSGLAFAKLGQCEKAIAYFEALSRSDSAAPARYQKQAKKQVSTLKADTGTVCRDKAAPAAKG